MCGHVGYNVWANNPRKIREIVLKRYGSFMCSHELMENPDFCMPSCPYAIGRETTGWMLPCGCAAPLCARCSILGRRAAGKDDNEKGVYCWDSHGIINSFNL